MKDNCVIVDFVRTPLQPMGGALSRWKVEELARTCIETLLLRTDVEPGIVEQVIFGHAHMDTFPYNIARYAWLLARLPEHVPAYTVHCCGASGLLALQKAYYLSLTENDSIIVVGGAENYSDLPYILRNARYGVNLARNPVTDSLEEGELFTQAEPLDPRLLADEMAKAAGITREMQDGFLLDDIDKATRASAHWDEYICPVRRTDRKQGEIVVSKDRITSGDAIRYEAPVRAGGSVTVKNFGAYADGAAALMVMSENTARTIGKMPIARVVGMTAIADSPGNRLGAAAAVRRLLDKHRDIRPSELGSVELIADSSASMIAIAEDLLRLGIDRETINRIGSCLALGVNESADGITGVGSAILSLRKSGSRFGIVAASAAGGQGMAAMIEIL